MNETTITETKDLIAKEDTQIGFKTEAGFEAIQRVAKLLSSSGLVPKAYKGNIPDCTIAAEIALRMRMSPLMVTQNLNIINGRPSWSSSFLVSAFNICGRFGAIKYHMVDADLNEIEAWKPGAYGCYVTATEKDTGEVLTGSLVTTDIAKKEGWWSRKDRQTGKETSKWQSMPDQMLRYRAAAFFIRSVAPEISLGLYTTEEVEDFDPPVSKGEAQFIECSEANFDGYGLDPDAATETTPVLTATLDDFRN